MLKMLALAGSILSKDIVFAPSVDGDMGAIKVNEKWLEFLKKSEEGNNGSSKK